MSKIAIYRKYRPDNFDEVLGQDHIIEILKNAVKAGRVSHAYLFSGPRGTGKTSAARILAKEIGCSEFDLLEIDAASSRGIDEIRSLRDAVRFVPLKGKVKVYIIDEVHMLTKEAFNALLKTLEEPPEHAVFILATTESEKIPETIISRCQNFSFRKIQEALLRNSVISIAKSEGFELDAEAAGLVALFADGSFRDALGILDQALSLGGEKITGSKIREFLSVPPRELIDGFISALIEKNARKGIEIIQKSAEGNLGAKIFLKMVLRDLRAMLLLKLAPETGKQLEQTLGESEFKFASEHKDAISAKELGKSLSELLEAHDAKTRSYLPYLPLELALIKIMGENKKEL